MRKTMTLLLMLAAAGASGSLFADDHGEGHGSLPAVDNKAWRTECASCHTAFHPGLLPERSWRKLMDGLERHFGANAELDPAMRKAITNFLAANAADRLDARRARKVAASIPGSETPLRITETAWFERKHDELSPGVWNKKSIGSRANCGACHPGADQGSFDEHAIRIPR